VAAQAMAYQWRGGKAARLQCVAQLKAVSVSMAIQ